MEEALRYADARAVLEQLGTLGQELVLVGGQAVNFWAESYQARSAELQIEAPFTSKDIDSCGSAQQAEECAQRLHGRCQVFGPDHLTRRHAVVAYVDASQRERSVDFLRSPFGVEGDEVRALSIVVQVATAAPLLSRVMHPVHVLESRVWNVSELPDYRNDKGLKQLRASVVCAREFGRDLLDAGRLRDVLRLNERIFSFALRDPGLDVWVRDGVSVADAMVRDPRLPEAFARVRWPQMQNELEARRGAAAELAYRNGLGSLQRFEGDELRGNHLVAKLLSADGTTSEFDSYRPGNVEMRIGDLVRRTANGLNLVARGQERERSRGR
jgi:hypothetical protein